MQQKKQSKPDYGHEYLVDQSTLKTNAQLNYDAWPSLFKYAILIIGFIGFIIAIAIVDSIFQAARVNTQRVVEQSLLQQEWALIIRNDYDSVLEKKATSKTFDSAQSLDQLRFFSQNKFKLASERGFVYVNATNFLGRVVPALANQLQVAIILKRPDDFKLSDQAKTLGIQQLKYSHYNQIGVTQLNVLVPAQHWNWFFRYFYRDIFESGKNLSLD